jgi:hypothetical protein
MAKATSTKTAKPIRARARKVAAATTELVYALLPKKRRNADDVNPEVHILRPGIVCDTEARGHATPKSLSPLELVVDASDGFIPLWAKNTTLRWRFRERSMDYFEDPKAAKREIRKLLGESILAWGVATPVKFKEDNDLWDFEIVMKNADDCDSNGCTLASAFFPDAGRHKILIYPMMFTQTKKEQIDTLVHEIGHVFGLRHFFANISETEWPSEIFGAHRKFSIMNYGHLSKLTAADKNDLARLYKSAWKGTLTEINGTPIKLVKPYTSISRESFMAVGVASMETVS